MLLSHWGCTDRAQWQYKGLQLIMISISTNSFISETSHQPEPAHTQAKQICQKINLKWRRSCDIKWTTVAVEHIQGMKKNSVVQSSDEVSCHWIPFSVVKIRWTSEGHEKERLRAKTAKLKLLCNHLTVWLLSISIHSCGLSRRVPEWVCVCVCVRQRESETTDRDKCPSAWYLILHQDQSIQSLRITVTTEWIALPCREYLHTHSLLLSLTHTHTQILYVAHLSLNTIWHLLHVYWSKTLCRPVCSFDATLALKRRRRDVQCAPTYLSESRNCCHLVPVVSSTCSAVTVIVVLFSLLAK